jgi:hypothetical protein
LNTLNGSIHQNGGQIKAENVFGGDPFVRPEYIPEATPLRLPNPVRSDLTAADHSALDARWTIAVWPIVPICDEWIP